MTVLRADFRRRTWCDWRTGWRRYALRFSMAWLALWILWCLVPYLTPVPKRLLLPVEAAEVVRDRHGNTLRKPLADESGTRRTDGTGVLPDALVVCVLAAEDRRYFFHDGVDLRATARAIWQRISHGRQVSGASTISQQFVKLRLHRGHPRTLGVKIREIFLARALECRIDKSTLLDRYLEEVDFGNRNRGVRQAAEDYFGKPLSDLSLAECAVLASLPQAPGRLNPRRHPARLQKRRDWVLSHLGTVQKPLWHDQSALSRAIAEPLNVRPSGSVFLAPHFVAMLPPAPTPGQRTTLDLPLQEFCAARLRHHIDRLQNRRVTQGAVLVIENAQARIRAMVGSVDFNAASGQVNHCLALRSPGSTLKPFTYLLAFENGAGPWSLLADIPTAYPSLAGPYRPENYDKQFRGPVTARAALANSLNVPAVRLLADYGGPAALADMLRRCGHVALPRPAPTYGLGLTIGNAELRLFDLATLYSSLARGGYFRALEFYESGQPSSTEYAENAVASPEAVWLVTDILRDNTARVGTFSFQSPLRLPFPVAAKTGTSTDFKDNWTVGYTPEFTVAVWVGNSDNRSMQGVSGVDGAAPVFHDIMHHLHATQPPSWPPPPSGIVDVLIDPLCGRRVSAKHIRATREWAEADHLPPRSTPDNETADGRVELPSEFRQWFSSPANRQARQFFLAAATTEPTDFRILFPFPGTRVVLDPSLPDSGRRLTLETDRDDLLDVVWSSPTLSITRAPNGRPQAILRPGRHELLATHPATGLQRSTYVTVKER